MPDRLGPDEIPDTPPVDPDLSEEIARAQVLDAGWMPDRRDLDYPAGALLEPLGLVPKSTTWYVGKVLDQRNDGACVGFGWTGEAIAEPAPHLELGDADGFAWYNRAKEVDEWAGTAYEGTSVRAGGQVGIERGLIREYRWCQSIDDARLVVGNLGPVVVGVNWYSGMDRPDGYGFVTPSGYVRGGHCFVIVGTNEEGAYFRAQNSWGDRYGKGGQFLLSYDSAHFLFSQRTDWAVPVVRG